LYIIILVEEKSKLEVPKENGFSHEENSKFVEPPKNVTLRVPSSVSVRDAVKNSEQANGHNASDKKGEQATQQFPPVKVSSSTCQLL